MTYYSNEEILCTGMKYPQSVCKRSVLYMNAISAVTTAVPSRAARPEYRVEVGAPAQGEKIDNTVPLHPTTPSHASSIPVPEHKSLRHVYRKSKFAVPPTVVMVGAKVKFTFTEPSTSSFAPSRSIQG